MHIFHCWHNIKGSELKLLAPPKKCRRNSDLYKRRDDSYDTSYIEISMGQECCICGKKDRYTYQDFDCVRAMAYKDYSPLKE